MNIPALVLAAATAASTPAAGPANPAPAAETTSSLAAVEKPDEDKVVCRKVVPTGSHLPVRVCTTQRAEDEHNLEQHQDLDHAVSLQMQTEAATVSGN